MFILEMSSIKFGFISLLQAITETMPISSSSHMFLFNSIMNLGFSHTLEALMHLPTALGSIMYIYIMLRRNNIRPFVDLLEIIEQYRVILLSGIIATLVPVIISVYIAGHWHALHTATIIGATSIASGVLLLFANEYSKFYEKTCRTRTLEDISLKDGLIIGCMQSLAFIPGVSRLGMALISSRLLHFNVKNAWFIGISTGIPLSIGAFVFTMYKQSHQVYFEQAALLEDNIHLMWLLAIPLITYFSYYLASRINTNIYGVYRIIFGLVLFALSGFGVL